MNSLTSKVALKPERIDQILFDVDERIAECKRVITLTKQGLDSSGKPTKSPGFIRTRELRDMQLLYMLRDLLTQVMPDDAVTLSPAGFAGLDKLVYPLRRHSTRGGNDV